MKIDNNNTFDNNGHGNDFKTDVSSRFSIIKTILSDFALFAIVDNEMNKVVCHLVYNNGE